MRMLFIQASMFVSMFLFICIISSAHGLLKTRFARVLNVPLSDYADDVLTVDQNASTSIDCATLCKTHCYSFAYDPKTKKCNTYTKWFNTDVTKPQLTGTKMFVKYITDCSDVDPAYSSGVFTITPSPGLSYDVYCDKDTTDGPWTVMQNRQDEKGNFYRNWTDYKNGFGDWNGNFWSGLEVIHLLTLKPSILRIELVSWFGDVAYAQYSSFSIGEESTNYKLFVSGFSGNVSHDAMTFHSGLPFTTYDNENSVGGTCAIQASGAWWYKGCLDSNLNGLYIQDSGSDSISFYKSMVWYKFYHGRTYVPMMKTRMLVKHQGV